MAKNKIESNAASVSTLKHLVDKAVEHQGSSGSKITPSEQEAILSAAKADGALSAREANLISFGLSHRATGFEDAASGHAFMKRMNAMPVSDEAWQAIQRATSSPELMSQLRAETGDGEMELGPGEYMPPKVLKFIQDEGWLQQHTDWHADWNMVDWTNPSNGRLPREFLEMHGEMFQILKNNFPDHGEYFLGKLPPRSIFEAWNGRELEVYDTVNEMLELDPDRPADRQNWAALKEQHPFLGDLDRFAQRFERTVHNYTHNFFSQFNNPDLDMGDPGKNMQNTQFWELHGWIEQARVKYLELENQKDPVATKLDAGGGHHHHHH
jgi:hypothetical protein